MQNTEACISREVIWRRTGEACCPEGSQWLVASTYPSSRQWCCLGGDRVGWQSDRGNYLGEVNLRWRGVRQHCWGPRWPPMSLTATYWTPHHSATERSLYIHYTTQQHRWIHGCTSHVNMSLHTHTHLVCLLQDFCLLNYKSCTFFGDHLWTHSVQFQNVCTFSCLHFHSNQPLVSILFHVIWKSISWFL